jgi:hypothetical protein
MSNERVLGNHDVPSLTNPVRDGSPIPVWLTIQEPEAELLRWALAYNDRVLSAKEEDGENDTTEGDGHNG